MVRSTSIKIQKSLNGNLTQRVVRDGYGMKGKSKWIVEAVIKFLALEDYPYYVHLADDVDNLEDVLCIRFPIEMYQKIDEAVIRIRKDYPAMEAVQSHLIRASIMQRLIRA